MDRPIKFRAWHPEEKKMWIDVGTDGEGTTILDTRCMGLKNLKGVSFLMQYTGLKDKNGVEIFEGDIVLFAVWHGIEQGGDVTEDWLRPHIVQWDEKRLEYKIKEVREYEGDLPLGIVNSPLEVTGNIYENPELLEVKT